MTLSRKILFPLFAASLALSVSAQTGQLVRGDVDSVQNSNRFQLDCTSVPLVSTAVNLQALHDASRRQDIEYEMRVTNTGTATNPVLNVLSARQIPEILDMGNIRLGRSDRWHVLGPAGDLAVVYVAPRAGTGYIPVGAAGAWNLGLNFILFNAGAISTAGRFEFSFQPPNNPGLVGQVIVSQALIVARSGALTITNPACKEIRPD